MIGRRRRSARVRDDALTTDTETAPEPARIVLELRGVTARGPVGELLVDDADLVVERGRCLGVVGSSGSGKSLLVRAGIGLPPEGVHYRRRRWRIAGTALEGASDRVLSGLRGRTIAYIGQDALGGLDPLRPIGRELADVLRLHGREGDATPERLLAELARLGLHGDDTLLERRSGSLSGGQRQRVLLAAALLARPEVIIADEATTALDTVSQRQVLDALAAAMAEGTAVVLVSHDLAVVAELADRVAVMERGRVVETGSTRRVLEEPRRATTRALLRAAGAARLAPPAAEPSRPVLEATGLTARHTHGGVATIHDLSLTLDHGRTLGLVGASGSGKSTLARILLGLMPVEQGTVTLDGHRWVPAPERDRRPYRRRVAAIAQDPVSTFDPRLTVGRLLSAAIPGRDPGHRRASRLLDEVALPPELASAHPARLSGGQRQRVAIACALAGDPEVLICDEAVTALDATVREGVLTLLADIQTRTGMAILLIGHDLSVVRRLAHEIAVLDEGRIVDRHPVERFDEDASHGATRRLLAAEPRPLRRGAAG
ncbi:ABC transporter ATP-binding protein [Mycetocola reblochoni]|uniref:ABC transporter ATP-binding protein n=1 Tax=Mycetocola reblochoni TaxID=331618 RepID=UPI003F981F92